jgi:hypothetical protein
MVTIVIGMPFDDRSRHNSETLLTSTRRTS